MSGRDTSSVEQATKYVEQLKAEKNLQRTAISKCSQDLIKFTQDNMKDDVLLTGFQNDKMNPYRQKGGFQCKLI